MYGRIAVNWRPQKDDPYRNRLIVGGNLIKYLVEFSTWTVDITMGKLLVGGTISTSEARFMCCDIKNIGTPMERY